MIWFSILTKLIDFIIIIVIVLISLAYLTLIERKVMGIMQRRKGPNVVGILGLLQPFADGLKLLIKELIYPSFANKILFFLGPIIFLFLSFVLWSIVPFGAHAIYTEVNLTILYIFAISSLSVYGIILSGWSSNSKYAFLGGLRSTAQMVSYEISIGMILLPIVLYTGSLNILDIVLKQVNMGLGYILPFFPLFMLFFISSLAETNRPPFDLPEAEAELVAGYSTEYSAMGFAMFFIAEYGNIVFMSWLNVLLFFSGLPFGLTKFALMLLLFMFIWVRVAFPRYRYDQLMRLGWKAFLPLSLAFILFYSSLFLLIH
jgi:NADH-quinone oxidoreductase subunit H